MTITTLRRRVAAIRAKAESHDDETAHSLEDALYREVLREIAGLPVDPKTADSTALHAVTLATGALVAANIEFGRWCA